MGRARAERALLGDRRAPGAEDQRRAVARQIGEIVDGVGGADIDVHHHRLRVAVHQIGACAMATARFSCGTRTGFGTLALVFLARLKASHDRREIGAGIGEEIIDAVIGQRAQEALGGDRRPLCGRCGRSRFAPKFRAQADVFNYYGKSYSTGGGADNSPILPAIRRLFRRHRQAGVALDCG